MLDQVRTIGPSANGRRAAILGRKSRRAASSPANRSPTSDQDHMKLTLMRSAGAGRGGLARRVLSARPSARLSPSLIRTYPDQVGTIRKRRRLPVTVLDLRRGLRPVLMEGAGTKSVQTLASIITIQGQHPDSLLQLDQRWLIPICASKPKFLLPGPTRTGLKSSEGHRYRQPLGRTLAEIKGNGRRRGCRDPQTSTSRLTGLDGGNSAVPRAASSRRRGGQVSQKLSVPP